MATQNSDLVANALALPIIRNLPTLADGTMGLYRWSLTGVNGVDGEIYQIASVERGQRVMTPYCRLNIPAQGVARVMSMGFAEHLDAEGNTVAANATAFFSALDVSGKLGDGSAPGLVSNLTVTGLLEQRLMEGEAIITLTITGDTAVSGAFGGEVAVSRV